MEAEKRVAASVVVSGVWLFVGAGLGLDALTVVVVALVLGGALWVVLTAWARRPPTG